MWFDLGPKEEPPPAPPQAYTPPLELEQCSRSDPGVLIHIRHGAMDLNLVSFRFGGVGGSCKACQSLSGPYRNMGSGGL